MAVGDLCGSALVLAVTSHPPDNSLKCSSPRRGDIFYINQRLVD